MPKTIRIFFWNAKGRIRANYNWGISPPITKKSVVLITAGEAFPLDPQQFVPDFTYNLGDADVYVTNISPHDGGVEFIIHVDWPNPLPILVDITVLDDPYIDHNVITIT